ncbi:MAG: SDR family oxidoreductase [Geminicoccaceae bacterium]
MLEVDLEKLDPDGARRLVERTAGELGGLDILVNNAGIILRDQAVDYSEQAWRNVMQVNLDAAWFLSQAAGRHMLAQGQGGRIVNVASVLSEEGGLYVPAYVAAKHALSGLTKALANEWAAHGINVNAIAPGYTITANTRAIREDEERARSLLSRIPAGRFAEPEEMAGAVLFFCSKAASYCHGSFLAVDGGWLAR